EALECYRAGMSILGKMAVRDLAEEYDGTGVLERGKAALLNEPCLEVDYPHARRLLQNAIDLVPSFAEAHYALGVVARESGDPAAGFAHFLVAAAAPPVLPKHRDDCEFAARAHHEAGMLLVRLGCPLPAEHCFQRAVEIDKNMIRAHAAYATSLSDRGERRAA